MRQFIHSGDLGDVIYSLPTVKAMGGGSILLTDMPGVQTAHGMTPARRDVITSLLRAQPYVTAVYGPFSLMGWTEGDQDIDLNTFRRLPRDLCNEWLPNHYLDVHGVPRSAALEPWLTVEPPYVARPVVIARSARYHNPRFPWKRVMEKYGQYSVFVGTPAEHAAFVQQFGDIQYDQTTDLLHLARKISTCMLFIGNQSCPLAIAEGLKKPIICEVCPYCPNCISPRADFFAGRDENVHLPDLEHLCHMPARPSAATSTPTPAS